MNVISIDQNSHSLWDTLPKIQALAHAGRNISHYVEDIDVAFAAKGAEVDDPHLKIVPERFYATGGSDWGAALFYNDFLGRVAVDIRRWEPLLGGKLKHLSHDLSTTVQELFEKYSVGDNWMLVGSSFVGDRQHHRLIGDLHVRECEEALWWMFDRAQNDTLARFPSPKCRQRTEQWFTAERSRLERLLTGHINDGLTELYGDWLGEWIDTDNSNSGCHAHASWACTPEIRKTSEFFSLDSPPERMALPELFVRDYAQLSNLYNTAVTTSNVGVHPLDTASGELPFYLVFRRGGRYVRCECRLDGGTIIAGDMEFAVSDGLPLAEMKRAGVECLTGKAALLVLQVRAGQSGAELALPYHGSVYMPAVHEFERLLLQDGFFPQGHFKPVLRVRFCLLDRMAELDDSVVINLPEHLVEIFGRDYMQAREFAAEYGDVMTAARKRLADFADEAKRRAWMAGEFAAEYGEMATIDGRRRELAQASPNDPQMRIMWKSSKELHARIQAGYLHRLHLDSQAAELDFYDSRGAILPWCVAMGGEDFYRRVIETAEIYEENHE